MTAHDGKSSDDPQGKSPGKAPYHSPRLVVHGDFQTLTRNKGGAKSEGAGFAATRP